MHFLPEPKPKQSAIIAITKRRKAMIDWAAAVFELGGVWLAGDKSRWCFPFFWACELLWLIVAIRSRLWGLAAMVAVFAILNVRNYIKWSKK